MLRISFCAQGHINQTIEVTHPDYTEEQVFQLIKNGDAFTTIVEYGLAEVAMYNMDKKIVLGKVVDTENCLEYFDYENEDQDEELDNEDQDEELDS